MNPKPSTHRFRRFDPPFFLRPASVQTALASAGLRALGNNPMTAAAHQTIVVTAQGVRLLGCLSRQSKMTGKGLVILLHGWEGSSNSTYIRTTGRALFSRGFDVFRLNLRDHGPSHHLNTGIFYAVLLDEVFDAIRQVAEKESPRSVFLAGFSLGGNFALRIARQAAGQAIAGLRKIVAVSPVLDPDKATSRIDANRWLKAYFLKKWRRSLAIKQQLFPNRYDFSALLEIDTIREMTEQLLRHYSTYESAGAYFNDYTLLQNDLAGVKVPTTIVTARDDPIIPVEDFYELNRGGSVRCIIHSRGGHNGFLQDWRLTGWYEQLMADLFAV